MEGFGNVISEILIEVNQNLLGKKEGLDENLVCYLKNERTLKKKEIIPQRKIKSRRQMVDLMVTIDDILKSKLTDNELNQLADEEKTKVSSLGMKVPLSGNFSKDKCVDIYIPVDEIVYIPQKPTPDFFKIISKFFGIPSQKIIRKINRTKSKSFKQELDHDFTEMLMCSISPSIDKLLELKKIDKDEFEQIKDIMMLLQSAYSTFCNNSRSVTKKDTTTSISGMRKAKLITAKQETLMKNELLAKERTICGICNSTFEKRRKTQKYCDKCSNSAEYQKIIRKKKKRVS